VQVDILAQGYPGGSTRHGGLGWSTVVLLRGGGRIAVIDSGGFGFRRVLLARLVMLGVSPSDITDLLITHLHHDHVINWPVFPSARMHVGMKELDWALRDLFFDLFCNPLVGGSESPPHCQTRTTALYKY